MTEKIEHKMIERAVELWGRKLYNPVFDNGDTSENGWMGHALASMNTKHDKDKIDNLKERVEKFKTILLENLIEIQDDPDRYLDPFLSVDYGPGTYLADAADQAGIPHSLFSCKSSIYASNRCVSVSFGYGADHVYHYPLANNGWLITTLSGTGSDLDKIKKHAMNGNSMGFETELATYA